VLELVVPILHKARCQAPGDCSSANYGHRHVSVHATPIMHPPAALWQSLLTIHQRCGSADVTLDTSSMCGGG
jgi:hypothetical protein